MKFNFFDKKYSLGTPNRYCIIQHTYTHSPPHTHTHPVDRPTYLPIIQYSTVYLSIYLYICLCVEMNSRYSVLGTADVSHIFYCITHSWLSINSKKRLLFKSGKFLNKKFIIIFLFYHFWETFNEHVNCEEWIRLFFSIKGSGKKEKNEKRP